jgi:hypothetical protein
MQCILQGEPDAFEEEPELHAPTVLQVVVGPKNAGRQSELWGMRCGFEV